MATKLPRLYESYKTFMDECLFRSVGHEALDANEEEQLEFTKKFYADLEGEVQQEANRIAGQESPSNGSGEE